MIRDKNQQRAEGRRAYRCIKETRSVRQEKHLRSYCDLGKEKEKKTRLEVY